ncbi:heavy metal-associated isoprenylated plant protein 28-like isoform X1 [Cucurbita moschata]|uniref:Heavy metal-associated isoprenylated plant protein 28-like isoform X1 n=1 Tax=Cucurbita moschata TaxID=3662 RepID=A0A6J1EGT2_CUCMO|nr:heavy metal-associated isoprenylated plant protein 28-like isoform X1 [Cucurbita moschata]XP_022927014.1 heavy metal-associated isoprenylated plant protein 28-like isoform X1 [Cucurbita moschata]XP_022927015.1 heavy metal-associated isoprenylated plant protein 28-like isoform X1 [Cucurbita moschata]
MTCLDFCSFNLYQVTEMRVHMDCTGCEKQVRKALESLPGVDDVIIDLSLQKVTVMGWAKQKKILKAARRNGRTAELWPYPYNPQYHGFIHHYQHYLNSPQHHHQPQPQPQPQTKPIITYNSLSSSFHKHNMSPIHEYNSYNYSGSDADDYGYHQEPPFSTIDEEAGAMFSDENPHSCAIM